VNGLDALHAAGLGLGLGVVTGMPLGVINVAIVDAATAGRRRFATGLGLGGGAADAIGRVRPGHPALTLIPRIALILLIGIAIAGVVRAMTAAPA